jgi:hypothetical protein
VKGYKLWDPAVKKVLYSKSVIFKEMKPSIIDLQPKEEEKQKEVVQISSTPMKDELCTLVELDDEESSSSYESFEEEEPQPQQLRRSTHVKWKLERFGYSLLDSSCIFSLITNTDEPRTIQEAMNVSDANFWMKAIDEVMATLKKNNTWDLVPLHVGRKYVGCKWAFKNCGPNGSVEKYKAWLVTKGYS